MAMKAIPMRGRLTGKRIAGILWAGPGRSFHKKENYFQLEHNKLVSAVLSCASGAFWIRCHGASCRITLRGPRGKILATTVLALPHGKAR